MTRKDYVAIAAAIKSIGDKVVQPPHPAYLDALEDVVESLCDVFAQDNPRFDVNRFKVACGAPEGYST